MFPRTIDHCFLPIQPPILIPLQNLLAFNSMHLTLNCSTPDPSKPFSLFDLHPTNRLLIKKTSPVFILITKKKTKGREKEIILHFVKINNWRRGLQLKAFLYLKKKQYFFCEKKIFISYITSFCKSVKTRILFLSSTKIRAFRQSLFPFLFKSTIQN